MRIGVDAGGTFTDFVVLHDDGRLEAFKFLSKAMPNPTVPRSDLTRYNDNLPDHASLLAWFDRAITLAEQAE